jgi:hypothetical protein
MQIMSDAGSANTSVTVPGTDTQIELGDLKASIAAELAAELCEPEDIRKRYGLTHGQWNKLRQNPMFRGMVMDALKTFRGPLAAGARITKKAEIMLEDSLADLYGMIKDATTPSSERVKSIQTLADLAGRGKGSNPEQGKGGGTGFTLNINVGDGKNVVIQGSSNGTEQRDL